MIRYSYLVFFSAFFSANSTFAGYLTMYDNEDFERVANNVKFFYRDNYENLNQIKLKSFDINNCKEEILNLNRSELVLDFKRGKEYFVEDFNNLKSYVSKSNGLKQNLGDKSYKDFIMGLYFVNKLLEMPLRW